MVMQHAYFHDNSSLEIGIIPALVSGIYAEYLPYEVLSLLTWLLGDNNFHLGSDFLSKWKYHDEIVE